MKLFAIVALALAAVTMATPGGGNYHEEHKEEYGHKEGYEHKKEGYEHKKDDYGHKVGYEHKEKHGKGHYDHSEYVVGKYEYGKEGGYGNEYFHGYGKGREHEYSIPVFEFPPLCDRIREHQHRCGEHLRHFFEKIRHGLHEIHLKIHIFFHNLFKGFKHRYNCYSSRLHIRFRKCKSDWDRVLFWGKCKKHHFKHWCQYEKSLREGKARIYSRYQHDLVCSLRKYQEEMKEEYRKREEECRPVQDVYSQADVEYGELVGYAGYEAPYGKHEEHH